MEVRYRREVNHNYMILDEPVQGGGYESRMLASNSIEGLLKFRVRQYEEKREFYYEITSRQPLKRLLEQKKVSGREIRSLILGISAVLKRIEEYLLREEQIILEPEFIYIDPDGFRIYLCLFPGYTCDFPAALSGLLQYLLEKINHQDREGVIMAYNLYQESLRENYGMTDLLRHLSGAEDKVFENSSYTDRSEEEEWEEQREEEENLDKEDVSEVMRRSIGRAEIEKREVPDKKSSKDTKHGDIIKIVFSHVFILAAAEGAIWYFTGMEGLAGYWPLPAAIALAALAVKLLPHILYSRKPNSAGETEPEPPIASEQTHWRLMPESVEQYQQRKIREDRTREEAHSKEEGTTLLSENVAANGFPMFESLNREGENIEITYVPYVIGKHSELADFCLQRATVSRLHLRIDKREGVYIVTDLNSTNGTIVEGYRLQANETVSVQDGDIVSIADLKYRFVEKNIEPNV